MDNGRFYKKQSTQEKYFSQKQIEAVQRKTGESTIDYYTRLAKQADQRLVRLEKLSTEPGYENITKWAYSQAQYDIKALFGDDRTRFNVRPRKLKSGQFSEKQMQAAISSMKQFLLSPTSTKGGINKVYGERAKTINERYGTHFNWKELAQFFENDMDSILDLQYGSKTKMKAIGSIQRNNWKSVDDITNSVEHAKSQNMKLPDDEVVNMAKKMLEKHGDKISKFFFK